MRRIGVVVACVLAAILLFLGLPPKARRPFNVEAAASSQAPGGRPPGALAPSINLAPSIRAVSLRNGGAAGIEYEVTGENLGDTVNVSVGRATFPVRSRSGGAVAFVIPFVRNVNELAALGQLVLHLTGGRTVEYRESPRVDLVRGNPMVAHSTRWEVAGSHLETALYLQVGPRLFRPIWKDPAYTLPLTFVMSQDEFIGLSYVDAPRLKVVTMGGTTIYTAEPRIFRIIRNYDGRGADVLFGRLLSSAVSTKIPRLQSTPVHACDNGAPVPADGSDCVIVYPNMRSDGTGENIQLRTMGGNITFTVSQ